MSKVYVLQVQVVSRKAILELVKDGVGVFGEGGDRRYKDEGLVAGFADNIEGVFSGFAQAVEAMMFILDDMGFSDRSKMPTLVSPDEVIYAYDPDGSPILAWWICELTIGVNLYEAERALGMQTQGSC